MSVEKFLHLRGKSVRRNQVMHLVSSAVHSCLLGTAEARHRLHQRVEHRLEVDGRAADDLEHVRCRGLLLEGFPQFPKQAGVFNGDHRLFGKVVHQLNLLVGERPDLLAIDCYYAN